MIKLLVALAILSFLDGVITMLCIDLGNVEINPVYKGFVSETGKFWMVKGLITVGVVLLVSAWKNIKVARILVVGMIIVCMVGLTTLLTSCGTAEEPNVVELVNPLELTFAEGVNWLGELEAAPESPDVADAYRNTTSNTTTIWNGESWETLVLDGEQGDTGDTGETGATGEKGDIGSEVVWLDTPTTVLEVYDRTSSQGWIDLDLSEYVSENSTLVLLWAYLRTTSWTSGRVQLAVRKNGTSPVMMPYLEHPYPANTGLYLGAQFVCGVDEDIIVEYYNYIQGTATADFFLSIMGYID